MLTDSRSATDAEPATSDETEGPRRRLWIFVILCCYTFTSVALDRAVELSHYQSRATVACMIYVAFSPVLWIALYRKIRDW
jgi:hypothetical protein